MPNNIYPIIVPLLILFSLQAAAQEPAVPLETSFPRTGWFQYADPGEAGWSSEKLDKAKQYFETIGSDAVLIICRGRVVAAWGDIYRRYMCHSVRKSYLSALYGIYVQEGRINLHKTLAELNIDDDPPLTRTEKQARIVDLLTARSGIYHPAAYETPSMKQQRPKRGSHQPGSSWYYNNWDFNTLCTIFQQETGEDFFQAFKKRIAGPLQMEDFREIDTYYYYEPFDSLHPAYPFKMSARDMGRVGLLFLRKGKWKDRQIIPGEWITRSTSVHSVTNWQRGDYGYMWWISRDSRLKKLGMYSAMGTGVQTIDVLPGADLVFVHRVNTYTRKRVGDQNRLKLLKMILDARMSPPKQNPRLIPLPGKKQPMGTIQLPADTLMQYTGHYKFNYTERITIVKEKENLILKSPTLGDYRLLPLSPTKFLVEDREIPLSFKFNPGGRTVVTFQLPGQAAEVYYPAKPSILALLLETLREKGIREAVQQYLHLKKTGPDCWDFDESELDLLGQGLLQSGKISEAVEILQLNVQAYPKSFNVYGSLARAYMKAGNQDLAAKNYEKAIQLNPKQNRMEKKLFQIHVDILKKIRRSQ